MSIEAVQRSAVAISTLALLDGLPPTAIEEVIARARIQALERGGRLFDQGEPVERAHVLLSGAVRIGQTGADGGEVVIRFIGPGEVFGSVAIFTDHCYPADGLAMIDSIEASWAHADLLNLIARYPRIAVNLVAIVGSRLAELQNRVREMATQRVECRIANTLLRLSHQSAQASNAEAMIGFPLRRKDIADIAGTTLHTASRTLSEWRRKGWIADDKRGLILLLPQAIEQIAQG